MIVAKGSLNGKIVNKQNLKGKINTSIEYIRIYPETQAKAITPTKQSQTVLPDENIYALSQVTVNPIPDNYIEPQGQKEITENGTYDVTNFASTNVNIEIGKLTNEEYTEANNDLDDIYESNILPNTYQQVEYLESSGTQYINTDIYGTNNHGAEIVYARNSISSTDSARIFGTRNGAAGAGAFAFLSSYKGKNDDPVYIGSNSSTYSPSPSSIGVDLDFHTLKCNVNNDKKVYYDDNLVATGNNTSYTAKAVASIFRVYISSYYGDPGNAKVKLLKIYNNGELIRNYIPCYRIADNEPGMYETITETFLTNDGTGSFAVGNDVDVLNTKIKSILTEKNTKILPENIKKDVNILGVEGSSKVLDTTDSNATSNDIVTGKTAFVNGEKITGSYAGIIPTGTININENAVVDVTNYASASVNVPAPSPNLQSKSIEITENGTQTVLADSGYDGLDEVEITTNVQSSGGGKNFQSNTDTFYAIGNGAYTHSGLKLTVNKTGIYTVRWFAYRTSTSYDSFASALYIDDVLHTQKTTWGAPYIRDNASSITGNQSSFQNNKVENVQLQEGQVVEIYSKSRNSSYLTYVGFLILEEE